MSAVDPSIASTIPHFVIVSRTSRGLIYNVNSHARCILDRPPEAHCGFISIDLMARQTPSSSRNVCCGSQRSIDNSTFFIFFSNTKNDNDGLYSHKSCTLETPPEADCGLVPSIYWRARFRQVARREFRSRARVHSREGLCGVSPNTLKLFCNRNHSQ